MLVAAGGFGNDVTVNVIASIIAIFLALGFLWGKYKERQRFGKKLEDYDFYPYAINRDNFPEFSLNNFRLGMPYFLRNFDPMAARQLIFLGEQNNVRAQLEPAEQRVYPRLFARYDGKKIADDTREYLENFTRIVQLIGKSFPNLMSSAAKVTAFFQTFCRTELQLDENILSREEYAQALKSKRHSKDGRFE